MRAILHFLNAVQISFGVQTAGDGFKTLKEEDSVEFEIVQGPKRSEAADVRKVECCRTFEFR